MKNTKKKIVVDSSVAVKWINSLDEDYLDKADKLIKDVQNSNIDLIMPELAKYEIGNALLNKQLSLEQLQTTLEDFYTLPISYFSEDKELSLSTAELAQKYQITYYDASFIALAAKLKASLITDNPKHQKKSIKEIEVFLLKDYR
ncbi:hypothetical protein A3A93_05390 [Candidatus Roizmanbacteria bacterium RIFCSPLOWO2_01_FULL_38_12]|uniref:PIN domain-containing protein n=1 Tax=Candidatus Roizmanbacteria bacterium RIFCSPLOWO2_01_FULL_38_12 TaxID=1802061 RepID=A0A1F7IZ34_9BACT|nr:MAG: hypothetical protein A2861_03605 [Candidatus Roizmanbacteria bacterium RIFCSPHIGHO2_01_FULL_38_15]OGK35654.1 MAG: hypothetical protein A3F59_01820 [Candidatus Roizmanbacteria bacterium RIFCSPHIGHO2_12_FULL_38_13]OGK48620.1 MAG: hypothetical protein A3A93_05390 [Candidatus Roizmanbacteria bacterium RIFCSPLOWO2_01_FULL_38_12]